MSEGRQTRRDVLATGGSVFLFIANGCLGLQEDEATATTTVTTTATQSPSETPTQTRIESAETETATETETETEEPPSRIGEWEIQFDSQLVEKPILREEQVVVFTERGVYGVDRQSGELVYARDLISNDNRATNDPSVLLGNRVHPNSGYSTDLKVIDPQDGAISTITLPQEMGCETASPDGTTVYGYGIDPDELLAINVKSQAEIWRQPLAEDKYPGTLLYTTDHLLHITRYGEHDDGGAVVSGHDLQTGERVWEQRFHGGSQDPWRYEFTATSDGTFILTFAGGRILTINTADGSVRWDTTHSPSSDQVAADALAADQEGVYFHVGTTSDTLLKCSLDNGQKIWSVQPSLKSSLVGVPTFVGEYLLQNSNGGTVTLNRSSGEVVHRRLMDGTVIPSGEYGIAETIAPETGLTLGDSLVFFGISGNRVVAAPRQEFGI